jgi:phospholipid transport system substrate-binding protein
MSVSRRVLLFALAAPVPATRILAARSAAAEDGAAPAVVRRLYDALLASMKAGRQLSFAQRYERLVPAVNAAFDLGLMCRIAVGPDWTKMTPEQQQRVRDAFARYTIATYANRFDDYGGEAFEVDPAAVANPNGSVVRSRIVKSNGEKVSLDYLMRHGADGGWKIIDVYLSGSISELASRRSEFVAVLQREGADGLVRLLEQRAAPGRSG